MTDIREQEMQGKIDELTAQKASLEAENKQLRKQVEWLRKAQFGRKSETKKVVYPEEQMSLFNEAETEAKPSAPEPEISVKPHKRKKKVGHREELLAKLPHQKIVVEPETTVCPECGSTLSPVGEEFIRSEVVYIPARVEVKDFYRKSYECRPENSHASAGHPTFYRLSIGGCPCHDAEIWLCPATVPPGKRMETHRPGLFPGQSG